ncbi:hypothetical protein A3770_12p65780 [Chloropicon primus]|uniref:Galactose oxidase n=1 Tax=Chloropicon primus TaxID=1764295 RepID=A0A5B8MX74_9CHLO|nr:hypothetical protein A3770_12p65780 [Chloropicon primus]|eukprot:QDZ24060.1 hypothetical protein A3770_12p65780 [Chloropicon primus]
MTGTQWSRRGGQHVGRNLNLVSFVGVVFVLVLSQGQLCFAQNNNQQQSSDLFRDTSWEQLQHASVSPGRRYGAATLSISSPKGLILFGGVDEAGVILGDTYQYFADQKQWVQLKSGSNSCCGKNCTSGVPCPRAYSSLHSMGTRALLFGGSCDLSSGASHELEHILESRATKVEPCEDTLWELDMLNNKWKRLYAEGYKGATSPPPRTAHGAISQSNSLYVYGGHTGSTWASDASQDERVVWEYRWDQNRWSRLEPQGEMLKSGQVLASTITFQIRKRYGHAAILHQYQSKNRILFHGGFQRDEATGDVHVTNDVLEWDITTKTWRKWELQYSPFRAFHTMHLYSPSSAFSQGTGYMVIAFGFGHDKPNTVTVGDVPSDEVDVVRGVDIHVFDDSSVTPQDFVTYDVLQGLKPTPRQGASGAFIGDGILITAGGYQDGATSGDAYWALHMRGQLYDQGTLSLPAEIGAKGVEEILVMSGEVEIGSWKSASPLPAQLDIPSGTDIIVLAFQNGTLMATEKLTIVPQETKTAQLVYLQEELVTVTCLREDSVSAFPDLDVVMDVFDVREKVWTTVASGKTDVEGKFRANVVPVRGVYTGALSSYAAKYETSYRFTATLSTENGSLQIVPNELLEVYPSSPVEKSYASALETLHA